MLRLWKLACILHTTFPLGPAEFQRLRSHRWLVAPGLDSVWH